MATTTRKRVKANDDGRDRLRKNLAERLMEKIKGDAFFAADFFEAVSETSKASDDGDGIGQLQAFRLIDLVIGDRRADVRRIVGSSTEDVFAFISEVIGSADVKDEDGDTLEK